MQRNRDMTFGMEYEDHVLAATTSEQTITFTGGRVFSFRINNASGQVCIYAPDETALDANSMRCANAANFVEPVSCTTICIKLASGTGNVYIRGYR